MSDDDSKTPPGEVPEGMVLKTRRVRKKRRSKESSASAGKMFEKGKELLFGMQEEDSEGHVNVAEQMRRLQKDADEERPLDEVWGRRQRSSSWLWILLLGIILPLIVIGVIVSKLTEPPVVEPGFGRTEGEGILQDSFSADAGQMGWFFGDSEFVTTEVFRILNVLNTATSPEEIAPFVRDSPYRQLNPLTLEGFESPIVAETISDLEMSISFSKAPGESGAKGILVVETKRKNLNPFTAYFVKEEVEGVPKVLLDWDATTAWSEIAIEDLVMTKPRHEVILRCLLEKKVSYDDLVDLEFDEIKNSGYVLSHPDNGEHSFAYVPLSNEQNRTLDRDLKRALDYGNFVLPLRENEPVTVRVRYGNQEGTSKFFEILSLEHQSWVRP